MSTAGVVGEILLRVLRISALIVVGVYLANVAVDRGVIEMIARGSRWLTRPGELAVRGG